MEQIIEITSQVPAVGWIVFVMGLGLLFLGKRKPSIRGRARVIDGDSIVVDGHQVRIAGIDAPEMGQVMYANGQAVNTGKIARAHLARLIGKGQVSCRVLGQDKYGRRLAVCYNHRGADLGKAMVRAGMAQAYGYRTRGQAKKYRRTQAWARMTRKGLWAKGSAWNPAAWRRAN